MRFVSLFAGVGGFDLGFELAGWECVGQVEIDKHCQTILKRHWPDVPLHDDVTTAKEWADECGLVGNVDVVCGGFPCQDVSVAGKRAGLAGSRTGLFWDALAFTTHVQAKWIILENVPGLATSNQGRDFGVILTALADAGYVHLEWRVLDSQFFGVPQRRRRMFIVGCTRAPRRRPVLLEPESLRWDPPTRITSREETARSATRGTGVGRWAGGSGGEGVAAPLISNAQGGQRTTDLDGATYVVEERERERERERDLSDPANGPLHEGHDQLNDRGTGLQVRHRSGGGPVTGTLSPGAHPGGFNGQDAYNNMLVVVGE